MQKGSYMLEFSARKALYFCKEISSKMELVGVPKELFLISLFITPDTEMYRYLKNKDISDEEIYEIGEQLIHEIVLEDERYFIQIVSDGTFVIETSILELFNYAEEIAKDFYAKDSIGISDLIIACSEIEDELYEYILGSFLPNNSTLFNPSEELINQESTSVKNFSLPNEVASFLTIMNDKFSADESECHICGREDETKELVKILMKMTKRNAVLVGEPGVGKTALVEKFTWMIVTGNCPDAFKDCIILSLDVNAIVAGTKYRGTAEERFMSLISFLEENPKCILFIDEIHLLLGAGACREGDLDLANALKPMLARGSTQVIGATTIKEYENYFSKDGALKRRFEKIVVNEPKAEEVYSMIRNQIKKLEQKHKTTISKELVDFVILNASCYNFETKNPDRTLDLLDKTMVCAELEGRSEVTKQDVLENFSINKRKFEKLTETKKKSTAYHEAGHYIIHRFATELIEFNTLAISIMPAEGYLGVNVFEIDQEATPNCTREYFVQLLASYLAGRAAEKMYSNSLTAGASSDLKKANQIAKDVIAKYGLDETFSQDRVFFDDRKNSMCSGEVISKINTHMDEILKEAREYCEKLLTEKKVYLEALVEALMTSGILSAAEIEKVFEECDLKYNNENSQKIECKVEEMK